MDLNEKFEKLNTLVVSLKMNEEEIEKWFQSRRNSSSGDSKSTSRSEGVKSIFPIVYKKGDMFEILPELDLARKEEVWGYEIMPGIIMAKRCGSNGSIAFNKWNSTKFFAENCMLNGKQGKMPSRELVFANWNKEIAEKIIAMDRFLCDNGILAEKTYIGSVWCYDHDDERGFMFSLDNGIGHWVRYTSIDEDIRIAVEF